MSRPVFIALRPEIFRKRGEHITLDYIKQPNETSIHMWHDAMLHQAKLPHSIEVCGYANYSNEGEFFSVAMVKKAGTLRYVPFPHITLQKSRNPLPSPVFHGNEQLTDIVNQVWFGRSNGSGDYDWFPYEKGEYEQFVAWLG